MGRIRRGRASPFFMGEIEGREGPVIMDTESLWQNWKTRKLKKGAEYGGWITSKTLNEIKKRAEDEGYFFRVETYNDPDLKRKRNRYRLSEDIYSDYAVFFPTNDRFA